MRTGIKGLVIAGAIGLVGTAGSVAYARSVSAFMGQPQNPDENTFFPNANGRVSNNSSSAAKRQFCVALPVDNAGSKSVVIRAFGPDAAHSIDCFLRAVDNDGNTSGPTPSGVLPFFGAMTAINLVGANVPTAGALFACCNISGQNQAFISTINYNP